MTRQKRKIILNPPLIKVPGLALVQARDFCRFCLGAGGRIAGRLYLSPKPGLARKLPECYDNKNTVRNVHGRNIFSFRMQVPMEKEEKRTDTDHSKKKKDPRRLAAVAGIVLLVLMYIAALMAAVLDTSESGRLFMLCIFGTVAIPVLVWLYSWIYCKITGRSAIGDPRSDQDREDRT